MIDFYQVDYDAIEFQAFSDVLTSTFPFLIEVLDTNGSIRRAELFRRRKSAIRSYHRHQARLAKTNRNGWKVVLYEFPQR